MAKSILKEIIILILIFIALALVLAILLYGYSPSGKIVPSKIEYSTPDNISDEIASSADSETTTPVTITYELDETQINNSKRSGSLTSGRQNPFASLDKETTENTEEGNKNTNVNSNSSNTNDNTNNTSSNNISSSKKNETHYLPETGTK